MSAGSVAGCLASLPLAAGYLCRTPAVLLPVQGMLRLVDPLPRVPRHALVEPMLDLAVVFLPAAPDRGLLLQARRP